MNAKQKIEIFRNIIHGKHTFQDKYVFAINAMSYTMTIAGTVHQIVVTKTLHTGERGLNSVDYDMRIVNQTNGRQSTERNSHVARTIFNVLIRNNGKSK